MFWAKYEALCRKIGKSPGAVAADLGLSNAATTSWKKGSTPKNSTLKRVADYFGVSTEYFQADQPTSNISDVYVVADSETARYLERVRQEYGITFNLDKFASLDEIKATVAFLQAYRGQK